jgi:hypothetical protein
MKCDPNIARIIGFDELLGKMQRDMFITNVEGNLDQYGYHGKRF